MLLSTLLLRTGVLKGMLNDDVDSDDGAKGAATSGSVLEKKRALMGEEAADIVIGALQKVRPHHH